MARQSTFQNGAKQIVNTLEEANKYDMPRYRRLDVEAQQVNQYVSPAASDAMKLADALGTAMPELQKQVEVAHKNHMVEENFKGSVAAMGAGQQAEGDADNSARQPNSKGFFEGYMKMQGSLAQQQDSAQLQADWMAAPKEEGGVPVTFDKWAADWWQKKAGGIQDKSYLSGYAPGMAKSFEQMRDAEFKAANVALAAKIESDSIDFVLSHVKNNPNFDMKYWEAVRGDLNSFYSAKDSNAVLKAAAEKAAKLGDFETVAKITALFSEKHSDGTPGLKVYESEKETLNLAAHSRYQQMTKAERDATKVKLENEFDEKFSGDFAKVLSGELKLDDFMAGVNEHFKDHPQMGIRTMAELQGIISRAGKREETAQMQLAFNEMLGDVASGKVRTRDPILAALKEGRISGSQASQLITSQRGFINNERSVATGERAILNQERQYMRESINSSLFAGLPPDDKMMLGESQNLLFKQELSGLRLAFNQELTSVLGDHGKQQKLLADYQKSIRDVYTRFTFVPKVFTKAEIAEMKRQGTPGWKEHLEYFTRHPEELGKAKPK